MSFRKVRQRAQRSLPRLNSDTAELQLDASAVRQQQKKSIVVVRLRWPRRDSKLEICEYGSEANSGCPRD